MPATSTTILPPLAADFLADTQWQGVEPVPVTGDMSNRCYWRLERDGETALLVFWPPAAFFWPQTPADDYMGKFVAVAEFLREAGLKTPQIYAVDPKRQCMLLEDLGDAQYHVMLSKGAANTTLYYEMAIDALIALHQKSRGQNLPFYQFDQKILDICLSRMWPDFFTLTLHGPIPSAAEKAAFWQIWQQLIEPLEKTPQVLALWDFHSPNLMWCAGETGVQRCGIVDFQDALMMHPANDVAFLLEDIRWELSAELKEAMLQRYLQAFPDMEAKTFKQAYIIFQALHALKLLGQIPRIAANGKPHYLQYMPLLWRRLATALENPALAPLATWLGKNAPASQKFLDGARTP